MVQLNNDCFSTAPAGMDKDSISQQPISLESAWQKLYSIWADKSPLTEIITLPLTYEKLLGKIAATNIYANINVPQYANSAVDGYALCLEDLINKITQGLLPTLPISGVVVAGQQKSIPQLSPNTCMQIFTGGVLPNYADSVFMQEDCQVQKSVTGELVTFPQNFLSLGFTLGANVRQIGDDVAVGELLLKKGKTLTPIELALLSGQGMGANYSVSVFRPLTIGVLTTGDEIKLPNGHEPNELGIGEIYDSNNNLLQQLLYGWGYKVKNLGKVTDDKKLLSKKLDDGAADCDVIISTGGMSVGGKDFVLPLLKQSNMQFCQLNIKPGRPIGFGEWQKKPWIGLAGNPVAVFIGMVFLVKPFLQLLQGQELSHDYSYPPAIFVTCQFAMKKKLGRNELVRVKLTTPKAKNSLFHHNPLAEKIVKTGSAVLSSLALSDALALVGSDISTVKLGDQLPAFLLRELLNNN